MKAQGRFEGDYFRTYYADYELQNPPRKLAFYRSLAERATEGTSRPRVLEIGCAFGRFLEALGPAWDRFGTDVSEYAIMRARARIPNASFAVRGAEEIAFDGPFDLLAAFDVLEHLPDLDAARVAIQAQLAPGGHLFFVVPVYDGPTGPIIRRLDRDPTHLVRASRQVWLDWARTHFTLEDWWGIYRYLLPGGYYVHCPTKLLRSMTPAVAVLARKAHGEGR